MYISKGVFTKTLIIGIILLLIFLSIVPSSAFDNLKKSALPFSNGNILYVGGSGAGNYTTIQSAINASFDGDTIFVYNNIYFEYIRIDKDINIFGENNEETIIDGQGIETAVEICGYVNLSGFTIRNAEIGILNFYLPPPNDKYFFFVYGNIIKNNNVGLALSGLFNTIIYNNTITQNQIGISFFRADNYKVNNNNFIDNEQHAYFEYVLYMQFMPRIKWKENYWDDWKYSLPRLIKGEKVIFFIMRPGWVLKKTVCFWYNIDWHPAKQPYIIKI